ncbi:hypothetical protein L484_001435 [Morus notabilis]|uniref:Uncharacterized protein n=1 Tax=Morus notabilis TaxID=981085 RepID=W9RG86_9ROSA|nr:hypothetical protein L484_001435 [Morus notabilis]
MEFHGDLMNIRGSMKSLVCHFSSQSNPFFSRHRMIKKLKNVVDRLNATSDERFKIHLREF